MLIDNELKNLIPPLTQEEYKGLEESILKDGVRESIIVWDAPDGNRYIVDGHNRYEIAQKHGLPFQQRRMEFKDKDEVKLWMLKNQLGRRNLNTTAIIDLCDEKLRPLLEKQASERMKSGINNPNQTFGQGTVNAQIAKIANVSDETVRKYEVVKKKAPEELREKVKSGETTINSAYLQIKADEAPIKTRAQKEREELKQAKEEHQAFQEEKKDVVSITDIKADKENIDLLAQDMAKQIRIVGKTILQMGRMKPSEINKYMATFSPMGREAMKSILETSIGILEIFKEGAENGKN